MTNETPREQIRFCAFCPNVCRLNYPPHEIPQQETMAPSAMAYLAYAVTRGFVDATADVMQALGQLDGVRACQSACPYTFDIAGAISQVLEEQRQSSANSPR